MAMISPLAGVVNCRSLLTKSAGRVGGVFFFAAAAGTQQGQRQRGQQTEFFVHGGNLRKNPIKAIIPQNFPLEHP